MKRTLSIAGIFALFYGLIIAIGFQSALSGPFLAVPLPGLIVLTSFLLWGLERSLLIAFTVGLSVDLYLPFPFGTALLAYPVTLLVLFFLFRTLFTHRTAFSTLFVIGGGIVLSEIASWGSMQLMGFLTQSGETLALSPELIGQILLKTGVAVVLSIIIQGLWRLILRPLFSRFFTNVDRYAAR